MAYGAPPAHASAQRRNWAQLSFDFFAAHWASVLFSACIALALESLGVLRVLTKFSLLVVSSLASQGPVAPHGWAADAPAVVTLGNASFVARYAEKSPLDRCVLAGDIGRILQKSPRLLAVDFDLSPLLAASPQEQQCQARLDALLDGHAGQLLLLVPFPAATEPLARIKHAWMQARCAASLHFADGAIEQSLGVVTEQAVGEADAAGARMAAQLHHGLSPHICEAVAPLADARQNRWLNEHGAEESTTGQAEAETIPLNFPALIQKVAVFDLDAEAFAALPALSGRVVLFGGDWGRDDSFLTAVGTLPGIVVHAARLASLQDPIKPLPPVLGLWGDIVIALCFAWVIARFWAAYVVARRVDLAFAEQQQRRTAFSTPIMLSFVLAYAALVLYFFFAAEHMFSSWGVVIAPLLIALSILVDGFVSGPVEQISALLEVEIEPQPVAHFDGEALEAQIRPALRHAGLALLLSLAFGAACVALPAAARAFAAWSFALAQALLLALLAVHLITTAFKAARRGLHPLAALRSWAAGLVRAWQGLLSMLRPSGPQTTGPQTTGLLRAGLALRGLRSLVFWAVLAWGASILLNHSLHG